MVEDAIAQMRRDAQARFDHDPHGALAVYRKLIDLDAADIGSWARVGQLLQRLGQAEEAMQAFAQVKQLASRSGNAEWTRFADQSMAFVRGGHGGPQPGESGNMAPQPVVSLLNRGRGSHQDPDRQRNGSTPVDEPQSRRSYADPDGRNHGDGDAPKGGNRLLPSVIPDTLSTFLAGTGFLAVVVVGAASQLWQFPFVRSALLATVDQLCALLVAGYLGTVVLRRVPRRGRLMQVTFLAIAAVFLMFATFNLLLSFGTLGNVIVECTRIDMPEACNIQIEDFSKLTPQKREELNVLHP